MIVFELALAAAVAMPDGLVPLSSPPDDCYRAEPIPLPAEKPHKPVTIKRKHRLFKADPKPVAEPCGTLPPPFTFLPPEPTDGFTPIPELTVIPFDLPVPGLPPVEAGPCECAWPGGGGAYFAGSSYGGGGYSSPPAFHSGQVAPVPEPAAALLLLAGLGLLGLRRSSLFLSPIKRHEICQLGRPDRAYSE